MPQTRAEEKAPFLHSFICLRCNQMAERARERVERNHHQTTRSDTCTRCGVPVARPIRNLSLGASSLVLGIICLVLRQRFIAFLAVLPMALYAYLLRRQYRVYHSSRNPEAPSVQPVVEIESDFESIFALWVATRDGCRLCSQACAKALENKDEQQAWETLSNTLEELVAQLDAALPSWHMELQIGVSSDVHEPLARIQKMAQSQKPIAKIAEKLQRPLEDLEQMTADKEEAKAFWREITGQKP